MRARDFIDYSEYLAVRAFLRLAGILPKGVAARFGRLLAAILFSLGTGMRQRVLENLKTAFGQEKTGEELVDIARAFYRNMGLSLMEFARQPGLDTDYVDRYIPFEGLRHLDSALEGGRGVVLFTAHFGNWELLSAALALKGYRINTVVRPLDNKYLDSALEAARSRFGTTVIDKRDSLRKMLETLRGGGVVGILLDQRASRKDGVLVDFFGRQALTNKGIAAVLMRTGAEAVPIFIVRQDTFRHRVICGRSIDVVKTGDRELDIIENTQRLTAVIERFIRAHPDHWFWFHSRWARRKGRGQRQKKKECA